MFSDCLQVVLRVGAMLVLETVNFSFIQTMQQTQFVPTTAQLGWEQSGAKIVQ